MRLLITSFILIACFLELQAQKVYDITNYQAKGDGKFVNTKVIQQAIDDCSAKGGGTVHVPAGTFITGGIFLKTNVHLELANGAVLKANPDTTDYHPKFVALVTINEAEYVSVSGQGMLDGNGKKFPIVEEGPNRPYVMLVKSSRNVSISQVKLYHSARWTLKLFDSDQVRVQGVTIYSHSNHNNDGIDIDSRNVVISDCLIDSDDDGICLKSENPKRITENITITNCVIASNCNMIKMGTGSYAGFKNIAINNCVLKASAESPFWKWHEKIKGIKDTISGIAGIAFEVVDGGVMDQVTISNISMMGVQTPIFMRLGKRRNPVGMIKNITISNIVATANSLMPSTIAAVPGFYIENVTFRDMVFNHTGGGTDEDVNRKVPEAENKYPENRMFGHSLPAYGLYVRHAKNIKLYNLRFTLKETDSRPAIWLEDAHDILIRDLSPATPGIKPAETIRKIGTTNIFVDN